MNRHPGHSACAVLLAILLAATFAAFAPAGAAAAVAPTWKAQAPPEAWWSVLSISAVDADHVWAGGSMGSVWFFDGSCWEPQLTGGDFFYGMHALDATHVYAVTQQGRFWSYNGVGWTDLPGPGTGQRAVSFCDVGKGFAVGDNGLLSWTGNGGDTWTSCAPAGTPDYLAIAIDRTNPSSYIAWVAGESGTVLKQAFDPATGPTSTWSSNTTGAGNVKGIDFIDPLNGWAVDTDGKVFETSDGAVNWAESYDSPQGLDSLDALDAANAWASGGGGQVLRFDGADWTPQSTGVASELYCLEALDASHVWAGGGFMPAVMRFFNGTSWSGQPVTSGVHLQSVTSVGTDLAWACSAIGGQVHAWDGACWSNDNAIGGAWWSVSASAADEAWVGGDLAGGVKLNHWNGSSWQNEVAGAPGQHYHGVYSLDATHAWAVGTGGTCIAWNGTTWATQIFPPPGPVGTMNGVFALDANNAWMVGVGGQIFHCEDGVWKDETVPSITEDLYGVYATAEDNVFVVGAGGTVARFQNNWQKTTITDKNLNSISGTDAGHIWACGDVGEIWRFDGTSWSQEAVGTTRDLNGIHAANGNNVWAVGDLGTILYREYPAPAVASITPSAGTNDGAVSITDLAGANFRTGATVKLTRAGQPDVNATGVAVVSDTRIACSLDINGRAPGAWDAVVTNDDGKSATLAGAFNVTQAPPPAQDTWYLAEGSTAWGFSTYISVLNPNASAVTVELTYMPTGESNVTQSIEMAPNSRATVNPADRIGAKDFSTVVTCIQGKSIAADRTMSWTGPTSPANECHGSVGVTAPATTWYLPEGSTNWGFETWVLVQNPNAAEANITLTYMVEGAGARAVSHGVPANSRATFSMGTDIGQADASVMVGSDIPVIPERAMYRNDRREGHDSIGTTAPATDFYLAEGTSAWGFTTYVLVQNPGAAATQVNITYMTDAGPVAHQENPITMPANTRKTVRVNDFLPNRDFSTRVQGSSPVIAERAMYWQSSSGEVCHDSVGMASPHSTFYLPDGQAGSGAETWTLVQNPNAAAVGVTVSYLAEDGSAPTVVTETVAANSRKTFSMGAAGVSGRRGVLVTSTGGAVMVERAMYWNDRSAGTDTIGGCADQT